jgi:ubiquinone/menaquinone biosynthesis C-methylase UbiE
MFKYLYNIITSNNPNLFFLQLLVILAIIFIAIYLYRISESPYSKKNKEHEGFNQDKPYILKQNQDIYDEFFAEMYDGVNKRDKVCQRELFQIIKMTDPTIKNSTFLDVGSGTGCVVNELANAGYNVYGIDKSEAMTDYSETKYPNINIKTADVLDPMTYENGIFTHVMCLNFTIYELNDKQQFFYNSYYWLKPNAYLILHLVNPDKFSAKKYLKNKGVLTTLFDPFMPETDNDVRETAITADFNDCKYQEKYEFSKTSPNVTFTQMFTDKVTKNIRQNEQTMKMESIDEILGMAKRAGFIVHAKTSTKGMNGDDNQYLYVLERIM